MGGDAGISVATRTHGSYQPAHVHWQGEELDRHPDVEVYGISVDSAEATRAFVHQYGLQFPMVSFADGKLRALYRN